MPNIQFESDLSSLEPYILGHKFTGEAKNVPRLPKDVYEDFMRHIAEDDTAKAFLDAYDLSKDFYTTLPDFKKFIPKEYQDEAFYAAKNGHYYRQFPAFCEYILRKSWEQCNGIPNLLFKVVPMATFKVFCQEGYFIGGTTLKDVVCNVCHPEYHPVSLYHPFNKLGDFTEVYIPVTDMVAALPNGIAEQLNERSVSSITVTPNGLAINGKLLRTMAGHIGAINSIYDLREVI